jgi:hypothetical protein
MRLAAEAACAISPPRRSKPPMKGCVRTPRSPPAPTTSTPRSSEAMIGSARSGGINPRRVAGRTVGQLSDVVAVSSIRMTRRHRKVSRIFVCHIPPMAAKDAVNCGIDGVLAALRYRSR